MLTLRSRKYSLEINNSTNNLRFSKGVDLLPHSNKSSKVIVAEDPLSRQGIEPTTQPTKIKNYNPMKRINEQDKVKVIKNGTTETISFTIFVNRMMEFKQQLYDYISENQTDNTIQNIVSVIEILSVNDNVLTYACVHEQIINYITIFFNNLSNLMKGLDSNLRKEQLLHIDRLIEDYSKGYLHSLTYILLRPLFTRDEQHGKETVLIQKLQTLQNNYVIENYVLFMARHNCIWSSLINTLITVQSKSGVGDNEVTNMLFRLIGSNEFSLCDMISLVHNTKTLIGIIKGMNANEVSRHAKQIISTIVQSKDSFDNQITVLCTLGRKLGRSIKVNDAESLSQAIWNMAKKIEDNKEFVKFSRDVIKFSSRHCSAKTLDLILQTIGDKLKKNESKNIEKLEDVVLRSITPLKGRQYCIILSGDGMSKVISLLTIDQQQMIAPNIFYKMQTLKYEKQQSLNDVRVIQILLRLGVHLNSKHIQDHTTLIAIEQSIIYFIERVDFGKFIDRQLSFYADCRESFYHSMRIKKLLVHLTLTLIVRSYKQNQTEHTKSFVRGCLAFVYCTIGELHSVQDITQLSILSSSISLYVKAESHADSFIQIALTTLKEKKSLFEIHVYRELLTQLWGLSISFPNNKPLQIPLELITMEIGNTIDDVVFLCGVLQVISALGMSSFCYHINADNEYSEKHADLLVTIVGMLKERALSEELQGNDKLKAICMFVDVLLTMMTPNKKMLIFCKNCLNVAMKISPESMNYHLFKSVTHKLDISIQQLDDVNNSNDQK
ncbi:Esophageal cancer associated protein [Entamoeba marina]